jgi:beta-xylosidase
LVAAGPVVLASLGAPARPVSAAVPAERTAYDAPPPTTSPLLPGVTITPASPQLLDQSDPFMFVDDGRYYLFTSKDGPGVNLPVRSASILGQWGPVTDALPVLPQWAAPGWAWAPDVHRFGSRYVLYFTTLLRDAAPSTMCIGDAVSSQVTGPYVARPTPFICQPALGGSIDPRTFVDADGHAFMLWKSDQNARWHTVPTAIFSQPLSADGLRLLGVPARILEPDEPWQGFIVEAPDLVQVEGAYYLFYSGNWFNQPTYAIGAARCTGPLGPCADTSPTPLLASNFEGMGPGEESVFSDDRGIWLLYSPFHSAVPDAGAARPALVARLGFGPAGPYVAETPTAPAGA